MKRLKEVSRISRLSSTATKGFILLSVFVSLLFLLPSGIMAVPNQTTNMQVQWTPNTESDLDGYRLYYNTSANGLVDAEGGLLPTTRMAQTTRTFQLLNDLGLSEGVEYVFGLTAFDTSNNESGLSVTVLWTYDGISPAIPLGLGITVTMTQSTTISIGE
jgi:hypothetical protein